MKFTAEKEVLPAFPKTAHLPHKPNTDKLDKVASVEDAAIIFSARINAEEKIDGSSCGMTLWKGEPLIRNRDHVLRKGYYKGDSAAKMQFTSVWNWWYDNKEKFEHVADLGPYSVYGEWCVAQHGIYYDRLPDWFIAYDVYDYEKKIWLDPDKAHKIIDGAGFYVPSLILRGDMAYDDEKAKDLTYDRIERWANFQSVWSNSKAEGVYIKVGDGDQITHRFKMVREDFVRGLFWNPKKMSKNKLK